MAKKITGPEVKVGSIWADNSVSGEGRSIQVTAIEHGYAVCVTLTNSREVQRDLHWAAKGWAWNARDMRGSVSRIRLDRFRPTSHGYAHVTDTPRVTDDALASLLAAEA